MKRALMILWAVSGLGLLGGCGIPFNDHGGGARSVPPVGTSGSSGTSGTTGSCGPCSQLDERGCLARKDCAAAYEDTCSGRRFQRCEDKVCPAVACAQPSTGVCRVVEGSDGCPACDCSISCATNADCPSGYLCEDGGRIGDGRCVQAPTGCQSDADCPHGESCVNGQCSSSLDACLRACPAVAMDCLSPYVCWSDGRSHCTLCEAACYDATQISCGEDGGVEIGDGGYSAGDGGVGDPACMTDADCPAGMVCPRPMGICQPAPPHNCGTTDCTAGEVCVHRERGIGISWSCEPYPAQCAQSTCDCVGQAICGGTYVLVTDCSGTVVTVTCECLVCA